MTYRTDKFKTGDRVTWFDDGYATLIDGRAKYGNGPFTVGLVVNLENIRYPGEYQSTWQSVGHTQHLFIDEIESAFSGAFFKKVE